MSNHRIPDASSFDVDMLKRMNPTSWRLLTLVLAGSSGVAHMGNAEGMAAVAIDPDPEDRRKAADLVQKALDLWHAEVVDETRALLGRAARGIPLLRTVDEWMSHQQEGIRDGTLTGPPVESLRVVVNYARATLKRFRDAEETAQRERDAAGTARKDLERAQELRRLAEEQAAFLESDAAAAHRLREQVNEEFRVALKASDARAAEVLAKLNARGAVECDGCGTTLFRHVESLASGFEVKCRACVEKDRLTVKMHKCERCGAVHGGVHSCVVIRDYFSSVGTTSSNRTIGVVPPSFTSAGSGSGSFAVTCTRCGGVFAENGLHACLAPYKEAF